MCSPNLETHIPSDMCSPTWKTHIPSDMCSPTWKTLIPFDMFFPTRETHIPSDTFFSCYMCSPTFTTHIQSDMFFPSRETHIHTDMSCNTYGNQNGTFSVQVNDWVNLSSILTSDLSVEYMNIKTSKKRPWTPSLFSLSTSFCRGIQSKAFLKSTKDGKSKFRCFCGLDFTYLSISVFNVKMLSTVPCIFLKPHCSAFKIPF